MQSFCCCSSSYSRGIATASPSRSTGMTDVDVSVAATRTVHVLNRYYSPLVSNRRRITLASYCNSIIYYHGTDVTPQRPRRKRTLLIVARDGGCQPRHFSVAKKPLRLPLRGPNNFGQTVICFQRKKGNRNHHLLISLEETNQQQSLPLIDDVRRR